MSDCTGLTVIDDILLELCLVSTTVLGIIFHICGFIVSFIVSDFKDFKFLKNTTFPKEYYEDPKIAGNPKKNKLCPGNIEQQQGNMKPFLRDYMRILKCKNLIKRNRLLYRIT